MKTREALIPAKPLGDGVHHHVELECIVLVGVDVVVLGWRSGKVPREELVNVFDEGCDVSIGA